MVPGLIPVGPRNSPISPYKTAVASALDQKYPACFIVQLDIKVAGLIFTVNLIIQKATAESAVAF